MWYFFVSVPYNNVEIFSSTQTPPLTEKFINTEVIVYKIEEFGYFTLN